ncbi:MAG: winged helix-turn-helix domain-containing protein [Methanotrichaceae archaeon]
MRKDRIEDRLAQLEQDIRTLKSDHREGIDEILTEIHTFQNVIIEEKIYEIRRQLANRYEKLLIDLLLNNAENNLDKQCQDPCVRNQREECHNMLISRLRDMIKSADQVQSGSHQLSDDELLAKHPILGTSPCNECFQTYLHEKNQLKNTLDRLADLKQSLSRKNGSMFISELPNSVAISNLVDPLSHENRFAMLKALSTGSMTFKELGELTDSKGGHLLYHLNKLINSGLVIKTDAGRYSLTDKGMGVMELIKKLYANQ